jgi:hypothetical protein
VKRAAVLVALVACGPRSQRDVTDALISAIDRKDVDAAKKLLAGLGWKDGNGDGVLEDTEGRPVGRHQDFQGLMMMIVLLARRL